jgi:hypothetical protein
VPLSLSATIPGYSTTLFGTQIQLLTPTNISYGTQYTLTLGGTEFGGAVDELLNVVPQQVALAISPNGPYST